jgi:hypothetical protein
MARKPPKKKSEAMAKGSLKDYVNVTFDELIDHTDLSESKDSSGRPLVDRMREYQEDPMLLSRAYPGIRISRLLGRGGGFMLPPRLKVPMRYGDLITVTNSGTVGTITNYVFRLNSVYDPDLTGTGHQPYGFDELMSLYTSFTVMSCSYTITATESVAKSGVSYVAAFPAAAITTNPSSLIGSILEQPFVRYTTVAGVTNPSPKISGRVDLPKFYGYSRSEYRSLSLFWGSDSTNPGTDLNLFCCTAPATTSETGTVHLLVRLSYSVEFHRPRSLAPS